MAALMPKQGGTAKSFSLYDFDSNLRQRCEKLATKERRTLSAQIQILIAEALAARQE